MTTQKLHDLDAISKARSHIASIPATEEVHRMRAHALKALDELYEILTGAACPTDFGGLTLEQTAEVDRRVRAAFDRRLREDHELLERSVGG